MTAKPMHLLADLDISADEQALVLRTAEDMRKRPEAYRGRLQGKILGMIFEKKSTRTRVSFEAGMIQLGGQAIFLSSADIQIGRGEPISDTGQVLSRYLDIIMIRTFAHETVKTLAHNSRVPVINGLCDVYHPCQALADLQTLDQAFGEHRGKQLVYVGDGNNVAHSLMLAGARAGTHVRVIAPRGYWPNDRITAQARAEGQVSGARIEVTSELEAVEGADAVYTDVWASMGQEAEAQKRIRDFAGFQVDAAMMRKAKPEAIFLHCLPAHRGEEVAAEVIDGKWSRVFDQAENRLHAQKSLMCLLLGAL